MQETQVQSLGWEDPLKKKMAIHSSIPAWRIPWTEEIGGVLCLWVHGVAKSWTQLSDFHSFTHSLTHFAAAAAAAAAKSLQSCPTLCDPTDGSPPGSPIPGILQAKTLEWVAISFSSAWKGKVNVKSLGRVGLLVTPWTAAYQAPPSMGFSSQEYWSGVPLPSLSLTLGGL